MVLLMASGQGAPVRLVHLPAPVLCNWLRFYFLVEHWNLEVCIYFLTQASFTVGYGDLVPQYPLSRIFTAVYVPIGTVLHYGTALPQGRAFCAWAASLIPGMVSTQSVPMHDLMAIARTLPGLVLVAAIGAGVSYKFMGMAPVDAFYFALSSTTATGYGDFTPEGRLPVLATIPFLWTACGAFAAMLEACHNYAKLSMVQKTPLVRVIDQLLLQPTPWDATAGGDHHMHAARAEPGAGLSEAEFMLACLCGHGLVGVPTLAALRKQFSPSRRLLSGTTWTAGKQPAVRTAGARVAAAAAASERRRLFHPQRCQCR